MEHVKIKKGKCRRISWGSIMGGVVTVLSVSFLLSLIGTSIGLFMLDPTDSEPFWGVGTSVGIWTLISLLISLAAGGFVAGKLAVRDGMIHGFLTWGSSLIVAVILGGMLVSSAAKLTGNILGSITSVTGDVLSGVGSVVKDGSSEAASLFGNINVDADDKLNDARRTLKKTGVKELQPDYINGQLMAVRSDLQRSVKRITTNPKDADQIINGFTQRLQDRIDKYGSNLDREKMITAIQNSQNVSRAQAESTVDQYMDLIQEGREKLDDLQQQIQHAQAEWEEMKKEALVKAEKAANSAAWTSIWTFLALLIGAVLSAYMGRMGAQKTWEGYEA